jgi:hypothetical protein
MTSQSRLLVLVLFAIPMAGIATLIPANANANAASLGHGVKADGGDRGHVTIQIGNGRRNRLEVMWNTRIMPRGTQNIVSGDGGTTIQVGKCQRKHQRVCNIKQKARLVSKTSRRREGE